MNYVFAAATIAFAAGDRVSETLVRDRSYDPYPGIDAVQFGKHPNAAGSVRLGNDPGPAESAGQPRCSTRPLYRAGRQSDSAIGHSAADDVSRAPLHLLWRRDRTAAPSDMIPTIATWTPVGRSRGMTSRCGIERCSTTSARRSPCVDTHSALREREFPSPCTRKASSTRFFGTNASETMLVAFNMADTAGELLVPVSSHLRDGREPDDHLRDPNSRHRLRRETAPDDPPAAGRVLQVAISD